MNKIECRWEVEDGYSGKSRPQSFKIDLDEMASECETEAEAILYIDQEVASDFESKISSYVKNQEELLEAWKNARAAKGAAP